MSKAKEEFENINVFKTSKELVYIICANYIEELEKQNQWISVEDRLPDHDKKVLVSDGERIDFGRYKRYSKPVSFFTFGMHFRVTHWQPLPDLPEDE